MLDDTGFLAINWKELNNFYQIKATPCGVAFEV